MNTNVKRLRKELQELKKHPEEDMVLYPEEDTIMKWRAFIRGPKDTPFEDRSFELAIHTTPLYPMEPPKMKFVTKIFHPNVHFKVRTPVWYVVGIVMYAYGSLYVYGGVFIVYYCRTGASVSTFSSENGRRPGRCGYVKRAIVVCVPPY